MMEEDAVNFLSSLSERARDEAGAMEEEEEEEELSAGVKGFAVTYYRRIVKTIQYFYLRNLFR